MVAFFMVLVNGALLDAGMDEATASALSARFGGGAAVPVLIDPTDGAALDRMSADIMGRNHAERFGWVADPMPNPVLSDEMGEAIGWLFGW